MRFGRRDLFNNGCKNVVNADACFSRGANRLFWLKIKKLFKLFFNTLWVSSFHVDFVNNWDNRQILVKGKIKICHRLGLYPLRGINEQNSPLASVE